MTKLKVFYGVIATAMMFVSCDEQTYGIGESLIQDADKLEIQAKTFSGIATRTVKAGPVLTPSGQCYFGQVKDPETKSYIKSEFTSQFKALESIYISPDDKIVGRYDGRAAADSCAIILYLGNAFNDKDSLSAMKIRVSELDAPIEEDQLFYTDYDPSPLVRTNGLKKDRVFSYADLNASDSEKASSSYIPNIRINLNEPYTKDGVTYNNYGTYIMRQYYDHPEYFANTYMFNHYVCPGFYFEVASGVGSYSKIKDMGIAVYYRVTGEEEDSYAALVLPGTDEVLQTVKITNDENKLEELAQVDTCTYLKTPAGLYTEVELPIADIMNAEHQNDSLLGAKITFQRINNNQQSEHALSVPSNIIMLPKDSLNGFFEQHKTIDSKTTFSASLSTANAYTFGNIANLIVNIWNEKQRGEATDSEWTTKHPDWNKVVLVPVTITTTKSSGSSSAQITSVTNSMALTSTMLIGGSSNRHDPIDLHVVYAKYKNK